MSIYIKILSIPIAAFGCVNIDILVVCGRKIQNLHTHEVVNKRLK